MAIKISEMVLKASPDGSEDIEVNDGGTTRRVKAAAIAALAAPPAPSVPLTPVPVACGDETTAIVAGAGKVKFHVPMRYQLTGVVAELRTPQGSGAIFTVDVNVAGASILSTKLTIDNGESTSLTAATAAVITAGEIAAAAEVAIDVDQVGNGTAAGLKVWLIGRWVQP